MMVTLWKKTVLALGLSALAILPAAAQKGNEGGGGGTTDDGDYYVATFDCPTGNDIVNGIEILLTDVRPDNYVVTALGINGFDPVIGVSAESGDYECSDDEPSTNNYQVDLPTTGEVDDSNLNAQMALANFGSTFQDFRIVVGGFSDVGGEVVVLIEGFAVTPADNAGDIYSVAVTDNLIASGIPLTAYQIARFTDLDPYMYIVDEDYNVLVGDNGDDIICDDAGNPQRCFGESFELDSSSVTTAARSTPGGDFDAMISLDLSNLDGGSNSYLNYLFSSFDQQTTGEYDAIFHFGIADLDASAGAGGADA